jgi:DNA-binding transcriptional regulator YiaG
MMRDEFRLVGEEVRNEPKRYRACGLEGIYLLNGYNVELHDGEEYVSVTKMDELHQAIGHHLVMCRKGLAPKEIRFLRKTMNMTQAELAHLLGNNVQSVARWEKGECEVPGPSEKLLRLTFIAHFMSDDDLAALRRFVLSELSKLDELDETVTPQANFQWDEKWTESPCEERLLEYA